jgi:rod shape-determining protein MreD
MVDSGDVLLVTTARRRRRYRLRPLALTIIPLAAILFQVYVPLFVSQLAYLELPLLTTVYYALMRREPVSGMLIGAGIGLVQDSLSHNPLGMFGIVKTLVGFSAASISQRFDVDNPTVRFLLSLLFYVFHQVVYWAMMNALLGQQVGLDIIQTIVLAVLNAAVAVPLFHFLDKL